MSSSKRKSSSSSASSSKLGDKRDATRLQQGFVEQSVSRHTSVYDADDCPLSELPDFLRTQQSFDISKKSSTRKSKYLFVLPGLAAPVSGTGGGKLGRLEHMDSEHPSIVVEFPDGKELRLRGTVMYPRSQLFALKFGKNAAVMEDVFETLVVFSEPEVRKRRAVCTRGGVQERREERRCVFVCVCLCVRVCVWGGVHPGGNAGGKEVPHCSGGGCVCVLGVCWVCAGRRGQALSGLPRLGFMAGSHSNDLVVSANEWVG